MENENKEYKNEFQIVKDDPYLTDYRVKHFTILGLLSNDPPDHEKEIVLVLA